MYDKVLLNIVVVVWWLHQVQHFCDPMDYSPPGSSVHSISQARILDWVAISFSRGPSWPRDQTCISCIDRQILYHWATREASVKFSSSQIFSLFKKKQAKQTKTKKTSKTKQNNSSSENKVAVSISKPCAFWIPFNPSTYPVMQPAPFHELLTINLLL